MSYIRASVSEATFPTDPAEIDTLSLRAALEDMDWGIRHYAVKALTGGKIGIDGGSCLLAAERSWIDGRDTPAFGFSFGEGEEAFLVFCLSRNGGAFVGRFRDNAWQEASVP